MAKLPYIELSNGLRIPILHEDRNVIAIDKPQGWMLAPVSWQNTGRNLFAALTSSVSAGDFWARSRNLKFIRFVHRLDAETSGVLLLVRAPGAVPAYTELFEDRKVQKVYLAVVKGVPDVAEWRCRLRIAPMQQRPGLMEINNALGKDCETVFRVIDRRADRALVMCWPLTGRTHQIRLHLAAVGHPVWGDELYGKAPANNEEKTELKLALRSIRVSYKDPFLAQQVSIEADATGFVKLHGFDPANQALLKTAAPENALEHPKARFSEMRRSEKESLQQQRAARRAAEPASEFRPERTEFRPERPERPRQEWRQGEHGRGSGVAESRPGTGPFRDEGRGAPPRRRYEDRPQRVDRPDRPFGSPRKFESRERPFGRKPFGGQRDAGGDRPGRYDDRPQRPSGYGARPFGRPDDFRERGERRPFGQRRDFQRGDRPGGPRSGTLPARTGVFPSSAKPGLKAGFQSSGFGRGPERRPFRSATGQPRPQGKYGARRDFGARPGSKFQQGKPAWGRKPASQAGRRFSKS